jgi:hypothetical protein
MSNTASATRGGGIAYTSGEHHKYFMPIQDKSATIYKTHAQK